MPLIWMRLMRGSLMGAVKWSAMAAAEAAAEAAATMVVMPVRGGMVGTGAMGGVACHPIPWPPWLRRQAGHRHQVGEGGEGRGREGG